MQEWEGETGDEESHISTMQLAVSVRSVPSRSHEATIDEAMRGRSMSNW